MTTSPKINPIVYFLSEGEPRPPAAQALSPLKRKAESRIGMTSPVSQDLFSVKRPRLEPTRNIKVLHPISQEVLDQLSPMLLLQIQAIEHSMNSRKLEDFEKVHARTKMFQILNRKDTTENEQLIELGILYYYCATGRLITASADITLLEGRLQAIVAEVNTLQIKHEDLSSSDLIPSGTTAYLLRTFVRMIFPPDGGFNLGGCYAVQALLNTRLHRLISEEMRDQIFAVTNQLLTNQPFRQLFREPFTIHPEMHQFICLDLKIAFSESMNFVYVRWSILLALFSVIAQHDEGNCFAVAPTINLLRHEMHAMVEMMIECLRTGAFVFAGKPIPIAPLMENRRKYERDLLIKLDANLARSLTPYEVAFSALDDGTGPYTPSLLQEKQRLGDCFAADFSQQTSAHEFFLSHKQSFLQQMLLAVVQFTMLNALETNIINQISYRDQFLNTMLDSLHGSFVHTLSSDAERELHFHNSQPFFNVLLSNLFFVDYTHATCSVVKGKLVFKFHSQGFNVEKELNDYRPFFASRRLYHIHDRKCIPIDRLTDFRTYCLLAIDQLPTPRKPGVQKSLDDWKTYLQNPECLDDMADVVSQINSPCNLTWENYRSSDSLFLKQSGGGIFGLNYGFKCGQEKFQAAETVQGVSAQEYFVNLCECVRKKAPVLDAHSPQDTYVLIQVESHVFNLTPERFKGYWENPLQELTRRLFSPGNELFLRGITRSQIVRSLQFTLNPEAIEVAMTELYQEEITSIEAFRKDVKARLDVSKHAVFDFNLQRVLQEFDMDSLEDKMPLILRELDIPCTSQDIENILFELQIHGALDWLNSHKAAELIQIALTEERIGRILSLRQIEQAVCRAFILPETITLGNLNWSGKLEEHLKFYYLTLRYDILNSQLVLSVRHEGIEVTGHEKLFKELLQNSFVFF